MATMSRSRAIRFMNDMTYAGQLQRCADTEISSSRHMIHSQSASAMYAPYTYYLIWHSLPIWIIKCDYVCFQI